MNTLYVMVGLSGSGKSTIAKTMAKFHNLDLISSDNIRAELSFYEDQSRNAEVFEILHKRIRDGLNAGHNVVADATNITLKSRKQIIDIAKRIPNVEIVAVVVATPWYGCIARDTGREHEVGLEVQERQKKKFEVPFYEEGFDDIILVKTMGLNFCTDGWLDDEYNKMRGFNQMTHYHSDNLLTHCLKTATAFMEMYPPRLRDGAFYHDIGKLQTRTEKANGECQYLYHANVGAYDYLTYKLYESTTSVKDYKNILENTFLINYHMRPFDWKLPKTHDKYKALFGEDKYNMLLDFHECDCLR